MNTKKSLLTTLVLLFIVLLASQCKDKKDHPNDMVTPVPLPSNLIPGFNFPEDSNKIYSWVNDSKFPNKYDSVSIFNHAWGIWAGLTEPTNQTYAGDKLLVFETWNGISEIQDYIIAGDTSGGCIGNKARPGRAMLSRPNQFTKHGNKSNVSFVHSTGVIDSSLAFWVTVSYSPEAACFTTQNSLLDSASVAARYAKNNAIGSIPSFPQKSMTIKPTYMVGKVTDSLIVIPVVTQAAPAAAAWGSNVWPKRVYVDVKNRQADGKTLVPVDTGSKDPIAIAAATCNLKDFIYFKIDEKMAKLMNEQDRSQGLSGSSAAVAGDLALLVCMHVTTKEISNWTWQTYYWVPNADSPYAPSSMLAASLKPKQLKGAASHYALNAAYVMVTPNQPINNGTGDPSKVSPMFGYNPYLEGGFTGLNPTTTLPNSQYGVQTNCMSCHSLATLDGGNPYITDGYVSMNDTSLFKNKVQVDFAWSIQGNLISSKLLKKNK